MLEQQPRKLIGTKQSVYIKESTLAEVVRASNMVVFTLVNLFGRTIYETTQKKAHYWCLTVKRSLCLQTSLTDALLYNVYQ